MPNYLLWSVLSISLKAGLTMLTQLLAVDHAHQGLRVEVRGYEGS